MVVGLIARYGSKIVIATGPTREAAEEIALQLFAECGYQLAGVSIPMLMFDPTEVGGLVMDTSDEAAGEWTQDGWMGPSGPA